MKVKELFEERWDVDESFKIYPKMVENGNILPEYKGITVNGFFSCKDREELTSLENAPSIVNEFVDLDRCFGLSSLEGIGVKYLQEINRSIYFPNHIAYKEVPIKSHVLGLLKVKNLKAIETWNTCRDEKFNKVKEIINKHLKSGRRLSKCREELIEAGLKEYAKL